MYIKNYHAFIARAKHERLYLFSLLINKSRSDVMENVISNFTEGTRMKSVYWSTSDPTSFQMKIAKKFGKSDEIGDILFSFSMKNNCEWDKLKDFITNNYSFLTYEKCKPVSFFCFPE
jgi:hypothetical protein